MLAPVPWGTLVRARTAWVATVVLAVALALVPGAADATTTAPPRPPSEALLLIVDFSGSMNRDDGTGSTRIESAKSALRQIIDALPEELDVGMRVYGHRVPSADKPAACQDTELAVPVAPLDRGRLRGTVDSLQALGETPIGLSLQQAAADLPDGVPSTVILVSDGEDECFPDLGPEPCQVTKDLVAQGVDLRLETIGLQVGAAGQAQLQCMAEAGGGQFTSVQDAGLLADALAGAQNRALRAFEVRGEPVTGGPSLIDAARLAPGTYSDSILDGESLWFATDLEAGQEVTARVTIRTADVPADAAVALEWQDGNARRIDADVLDGVARGQASTLAVSSGPANGSRSPFGAVREPGTYYLTLRTVGFPPDVPHDFVLELLGEGADGAPGGSSAAPSDGTASAAPSVPAPAPAPAAPSEPPAALPPPPDTSPGPFIGLLLVLALGGGVGYLLWRRRRAAAEGPEPPTYF